MDIKIIEEKITKDELKKMAKSQFGDMIKGVVDIEKKIIALGGELHADAEKALLEKGSAQKDLWGINLYPERARHEWIEFQSLINIRPSTGHRSLEIKDQPLRENITSIIDLIID